MELQFRQMENGIRLIKLIGNLDLNGVQAVESKFVAHCAGNRTRVLIDLAEMDSLAPIGCHLLLWAAKEVTTKGGKFVLLNPTATVEQTLEQTGVNGLIPIHFDVGTAIASLLATG